MVDTFTEPNTWPTFLMLHPIKLQGFTHVFGSVLLITTGAHSMCLMCYTCIYMHCCQRVGSQGHKQEKLIYTSFPSLELAS